MALLAVHEGRLCRTSTSSSQPHALRAIAAHVAPDPLLVQQRRQGDWHLQHHHPRLHVSHTHADVPAGLPTSMSSQHMYRHDRNASQGSSLSAASSFWAAAAKAPDGCPVHSWHTQSAVDASAAQPDSPQLCTCQPPARAASLRSPSGSGRLLRLTRGMSIGARAVLGQQEPSTSPQKQPEARTPSHSRELSPAALPQRAGFRLLTR